MNFPDYRARRMRRTEGLRRLVRETRLAVDNLIYPLFVAPGTGVAKPIASMPGVSRLSIDLLVEAVKEGHAAGIPAVASASRRLVSGEEAAPCEPCEVVRYWKRTERSSDIRASGGGASDPRPPIGG